MGKFFQSDIIREELEDIFQIQKELYKVIERPNENIPVYKVENEKTGLEKMVLDSHLP